MEIRRFYLHAAQVVSLQKLSNYCSARVQLLQQEVASHIQLTSSKGIHHVSRSPESILTEGLYLASAQSCLAERSEGGRAAAEGRR